MAAPLSLMRSSTFLFQNRPHFLRGRNITLSKRLRGSPRVTAWFKFGKAGFDAKDAGISGSQKRDEYDKDDVEHYFNYMGMLATEGTYDRLNQLMQTGAHPIDILLYLAATEGDMPRIEELLEAGAKPDVTVEGKTAIQAAKNEEVGRALGATL